MPDAVLNKPGQLTADEKVQMQAHTTAGADTLAEVSARYAFATGFFALAIEVVQPPRTLGRDRLPRPSRR